ncbi:MAG: class I SAM-dependent DNA methyltransferase, partial [Epsilonproteobacteria bacterium]|nr:class I SAM-dependent DNA methyltransferase [Campylobacterota bacterium]
DWDVKIYRGVITGLNEAFIITTEKRNEILANCKNNAERQRTEAIIKPILRGRDIKRYEYEWAGLHVIGTFPALKLNIDDYPALKKYFLDNFDIRQLEQSGKKYPTLGFNARKKTGNKWFETQDQIAYYFEFEKEKVVYSETIKIYFDGTRNFPRFSYITEEFYLDKTTFFMVGNNQKYLLAVLNSKVGKYLLENGYCIKLGIGSRGLQKILIEKLPIPPITSSNKPIVSQIEKLVDKTLLAKKSNPKADTTKWEKEIDSLVYSLYELTEEEIMIIEES